jgi:hypothetical protein
MKIGPEAEESSTEDRASAKIGSKTEERSEENHANDNVQRKLIVLNWPVVFPIPIPEWDPPVNVVVEE